MARLVKKVNPVWPYLEALVFVLLAILANTWWFPANPGFRGLPFSLLWVPILLIAGRYGTAPAVFTGFLCGWYYFFEVSLENFLFGQFALSVDDKVMVFVFFFVSVFLGQMYDRLQNHLIRLSNEYQELDAQYQNMLLHYEKLERTNAELEKRLVSRHTTLNSLFKMARQLESLDEKVLCRGVMELVSKFLQATRAALVLKRGESFEVAATVGYGKSEEHAFLVTKSRENDLCQAVWKGLEPLSFRNGFEEQAKGGLETSTLMAAPIHLLTQKKTIGILMVDELPFLAINAANLRILGIIADWTAQNLEKTKAFQDLKARELDDQLTGVFSYSYFTLRVVEELNRAQRHGYPVTLLLLRLGRYAEMNPQNQKDLLAIMGLVFQHSLRQVDLPCRFSDPATFALLLPMTDRSGAEILRGKLGRIIDEYAFKPFSSEEPLRVIMAVGEFTPKVGEKRIYEVDEETVRVFVESVQEALASISAEGHA